MPYKLTIWLKNNGRNCSNFTNNRFHAKQITVDDYGVRDGFVILETSEGRFAINSSVVETIEGIE